MGNFIIGCSNTQNQLVLATQISCIKHDSAIYIQVLQTWLPEVQFFCQEGDAPAHVEIWRPAQTGQGLLERFENMLCNLQVTVPSAPSTLCNVKATWERAMQHDQGWMWSYILT